MVLILECIIICFILLVPCVVAIANGIHGRICHMGGLWHQWSERILGSFLADICIAGVFLMLFAAVAFIQDKKYKVLRYEVPYEDVMLPVMLPDLQ